MSPSLPVFGLKRTSWSATRCSALSRLAGGAGGACRSWRTITLARHDLHAQTHSRCSAAWQRLRNVCPTTLTATATSTTLTEKDMGISRHATAHWEGDLKTGQGLLST